MNTRNMYFFFVGVLVFVGSLCVGCSPQLRPPGLPSLHPCIITVTQEGKPVEDISVRLVSKVESKWPVTGLTNTAGEAVMVTYGQFPGAPLGDYHVVVSKEEMKIVKPSRGDYVSETTHIFSLIKVVHTKLETSQLEITIGKGKNHKTFEVDAPVRVLVDMTGPGR